MTTKVTLFNLFLDLNWNCDNVSLDFLMGCNNPVSEGYIHTQISRIFHLQWQSHTKGASIYYYRRNGIISNAPRCLFRDINVGTICGNPTFIFIREVNPLYKALCCPQYNQSTFHSLMDQSQLFNFLIALSLLILYQYIYLPVYIIALQYPITLYIQSKTIYYIKRTYRNPYRLRLYAQTQKLVYTTCQ